MSQHKQTNDFVALSLNQIRQDTAEFLHVQYCVCLTEQQETRGVFLYIRMQSDRTLKPLHKEGLLSWFTLHTVVPMATNITRHNQTLVFPVDAVSDLL